MKLRTLLLASSMGIAASAASAATTSYTDIVAVQTTGWTETLQVNQFDSSLGTLQSVMFALNGTVVGDAQGESRDARPATITLDLSAEITASTSGIANLATVIPLVSSVFSADAFDGTRDFAGLSGQSFINVSANDTAAGTFTGADMAEFIGGGTVGITLDANSTSIGRGSGNLSTEFFTQAGASIEVTYTYDAPTVAPVPLPAGAALMLGALGLLAATRRKAS